MFISLPQVMYVLIIVIMNGGCNHQSIIECTISLMNQYALKTNYAYATYAIYVVKIYSPCESLLTPLSKPPLITSLILGCD